MNFKKIMAIALVLVALSMSLTVISASAQTIDLGEITKGDVTIHHMLGDEDETYDFDIEVDISNLSIFDKKSLNEAIKDDNTTFIINTTSDLGKVVFSDFNGPDDVHISGNTLYIENSQTFSYAGDEDSNYVITSITFEADNGVTFIAK